MKCSSIFEKSEKLMFQICQGGKIPKSMYTKKGDKEKANEYVTVTVKKGEKLKLDFEPTEVGSLLRYLF